MNVWKIQVLGKIVTIFGLTLFILLSIQTKAAEGFSTSLATAPKSVKDNWSKTFAILTDYPTIYDAGTASLVWKRKSASKWDLYFLTANHGVDAKCEGGKICPHTYLVRDLRGRSMNNKFTPDQLQGLFFEEVDVVDKSTNPDLALLHVIAPLSTANIPDPISLPTSCEISPNDKLFTVGFPAAAGRTNPLSAPIPNKDEIEKSWSHGVFVDKFHAGDGDNIKLYFGTTIDALEGNSGGPVLNTDGTIVGVLVKISGDKDKGFRYDGNEDPKSLDWHSLSVRCEYLQDLKRSFENGEINGG